VLVGVTNFAGAETLSGPFPTINPAVIHNCEIQVDSTGVDFHIDELDFTEQVECPMGLPFPMSNARQPLFFRIYNKGTPPAVAAQVEFGRVEVTQALVTVNKPWPETLCEIGRASHQSPIAPFAATSNRGNSTTPATAALSNTVPSYTTPMASSSSQRPQPLRPTSRCSGSRSRPGFSSRLPGSRSIATCRG